MDQEALVKLTKDLKSAATTMTRHEARYLIDAYMTMQDNRKRSDLQIGAMERRKTGEPHAVLQWLSDNAFSLERQILSALSAFAESQHMGKWALGVHGVGPVVAAGLLAHIDMEKCPTVGHIWAFAGLDPSKKWEKGKKRPHNAALKLICYYAGESFIKTSNSQKSPYGQLFRKRKDFEKRKNEAGDYKETAKALCDKATPNYKKTEGYKKNVEGKLGDGHINSRARRYAVKQFLSDWHGAAYRDHFGKEPPKPYPIAILGHAHERIAA